MGQVFVNNGRARLKSAINSTQTKMRLENIHNLPTSLDAGDWFLVTLAHQDSRYGSNIEVVKVTDIDQDTYYIERAYEGEAHSHAVTDVVESRTTADTHDRMMRSADWDSVSNKPATATRWPEWGEVVNKPGAFTPTDHLHEWTEIVNRPATVDRWPTWNEVTDKPTRMTPTAHQHDWDDVLNKPSTATRWPSWNEVSNKPDTTASSNDSSNDVLVEAQGLYEHARSSDHDARYYTKTETSNRYLSLSDGGRVRGPIRLDRDSVSTAEFEMNGRRNGNGGAVTQIKMTNQELDTEGAIESWTDGSSHDLLLTGFDKTKITSAVEAGNGVLLDNKGYNNIDLHTEKESGNVGGIRFFSNGNSKGELNFTAEGEIQASNATFKGDGSKLDSLVASNITSGTLSLNRLNTTSQRTVNSSDSLLTALGMYNHTDSDDHDGRYFTKSQSDGRFVALDGYNAFNPDGNYGGLRARSTTKDDVGLGSVRNVASYSQSESNNRYLLIDGKADDADKLDGLNSSQFVRADVSNNNIRLANKERAEYSEIDGLLYHDASNGVYHIADNSATGNQGALLWSEANVTSSGNLDITYSSTGSAHLEVSQGANSNLDADTVDGKHASSFSNVDHKHTVSDVSGLSDAATTSVSTIRSGTNKSHVGLSNVANVDQRNASNITSGNPKFSTHIGFGNDSEVIEHINDNDRSGAGWSGKNGLLLKGDGNVHNMAVYAGHFHSVGASEFQGKVTAEKLVTGTADDGLNSVQAGGGTRTDTLAAGGVENAQESIDTDGNVQVRGQGQVKMGEFAMQYNNTTQSLDFNFLGG